MRTHGLSKRATLMRAGGGDGQSSPSEPNREQNAGGLPYLTDAEMRRRTRRECVA